MADRGSFYVGTAIDAATGETGSDHVAIGSSDLTTHGVVVGMTGSGKTGLAVCLLEEALLAGIPALVLDPKGDMGNLALVFPDLAPASFRPWVNEIGGGRGGRHRRRVRREDGHGLARGARARGHRARSRAGAPRRGRRDDLYAGLDARACHST